MISRLLGSALLAGGALLASTPAMAQAPAWPAKPVRIVVPFAPGGGADQAARLLAQHLSTALGQSFVVESKPGGHTIIGAETVARSAPDGYTLFFCSASTVSVNPSLFAKLPYEPQRDFTPVTMVSRFPFFIVVPSSAAAGSLADLIAAAKGNPLSYASAGNGTSGHLGFELLKRSAAVSMTHVPYKSYSAAMPDLLSGRISTMMADLAVVGGAIRGGKLRVIAATSPQRSSFMPEVPTVAEAGIPGFDVTVWFALFAPAGTPQDVIRTLNSESSKFLSSPEAAEKYRTIGHEPSPTSPEQLGNLVRAEAEKWGKVVREAGIKAD
jgi:tripartite-type tricarboxylate transporter receptor subunit TctC